MIHSTVLSMSFGVALSALLVNEVHASNGECIPIETLFAQPVYEVNVNSTNIGGYNTTGAVDVWSGNPLRAGSLDGDIIGRSTGKCTLLPGEQMWMCSGIFKISINNTITTMGLSPNNVERGSLAVTGGTGCYQNANGTIFITSQGETSESFLLEYQASDADETCSVQDLVGEGLSEANVGGTTIGDYETVGSKDLWAGNVLTNSSGARIGLSYGDCTLLPGVAAFMCIGEWALDSGDIVTYAGYSPNSMNPGHIAVTGGTGCYAGANGTLLLKAANEQYSSYDWNYQPKPEAETCSSLVDTLGGHLIYESTSGSIVIGDYDTPGSMDIWFNSSIYTGSHDGALLEGMYSLGECTLLTNVTEFMCALQFVLNATDGSSIVATGFSPNSFEDGTLAISGTGCFTGIKGELTITAQSIEEDYDYFSYEVKSTNEKAVASGVDAGKETDSSMGEEAGSNTVDEISSETVDESTEVESEKEGECIPIETLFSQPAYEVNVNATTIGGSNVTGAVYIWSENPLRTGSVDGAAIGKSTGKCTLLPGEQMWMCSGIFKISNQDTITTMGLSPNNQEKGSLAVTGGTGCYQNANGTIFITSQGEPSESFLLEYQASNADEPCSVQDLVGEGLSEANAGGTTIGDYETVGSKDLWAGNVLTNSSGARIGLSYGDCTLLPGVAAFMCIGEWALDSGDIVTYAGYSPNSMNPGHIAVTGGTGCYAGANGTLLLKAANEQFSSYDWNYQPKPEAETCSSLVDTLGGHLIYESTSGSIVIGDYDTPGSMDIWFNSSMYTGSHDGALLEGMYSLGECTLLTNVTEFMCTEQFVLNATDGSSIVAIGFSPNSFKDGTLAISGTGCFTGIKGGLAITAQSIEEDYDYFSYEVKSTNEADGPSSDSGVETETETGTGDFGTEETDSVVDAGTGSDAEESSGDDLADNSSCVLHLNVWFSAIGMAAAIPIL